MQEAYRPPWSKCSLCWSFSWLGGGSPIQSSGGYPHPVSMVGVSHSDLGWSTPPHQQDGVPHPCPDRGWGTLPAAGWGTPPSRPEIGYLHLPVQTWDGVPPNSDLGWGNSIPPFRPGMGYPPPISQMGYPPLFKVWTDKLKTVSSPILRMRAW